MSSDRATSTDAARASAAGAVSGSGADPGSAGPSSGTDTRSAGAGSGTGAAQTGPVVRRTRDGWKVERTGGNGNRAAGDDHGQADNPVLPDLVSAMVLAELMAGDVPHPRKPAATETARGTPAAAETAPRETGGNHCDGASTDAYASGAGGNDAASGRHADGTRTGASGDAEVTRLRATVAQLEHALAARVRIEQAIGVLAERQRLNPRQAFDLLRKVARSGGSRVHDLAGEVVASASNPLLPLPAELARAPLHPAARGRSQRRRPR